VHKKTVKTFMNGFTTWDEKNFSEEGGDEGGGALAVVVLAPLEWPAVIKWLGR
jgi:hypothetical protein